MLRFFEPEMETRWPLSAPQMETRVQGMWRNDASVLSLLPSSSLSSLLGEFVGNDSQGTSSNAAAEVQRLFNSSQPLAFRTPMHPMNCNSGITDVLMATKLSEAALFDNSKVSSKTMLITEDDARVRDDKRVAKKPKSMSWERLHQHGSSDEEVSQKTRSMKKPARKSQKLGDKITALQQLVSPFGKTDTASVLHEASLHIKDLHEQIQMLTTPYLGAKSPPNPQQGHGGDKLGLRQRGLCLVSMTSPAIRNLTNQTLLDH